LPTIPPIGKQAYAQEHHHPQGNARRSPRRPQGERTGLRQAPVSGYSPAVNEGEGRSTNGSGLAPIAVLPGFQQQGIGKALIEAGIDKIRASGESFVIVLGHPGYYPTFGFIPASRFGIRCEYDGVPDEAFMILVLKDDVLAGISGVARYRPEFTDVT
jgi:putative acetyltransferase